MKEPHEKKQGHGATISQASVVNSPASLKDLGRGFVYDNLITIHLTWKKIGRPVAQVTFGISCATLGTSRLGATKPSRLPREKRPWHLTDARHLRRWDL
jgi:hypothetical protein